MTKILAKIILKHGNFISSINAIIIIVAVIISISWITVELWKHKAIVAVIISISWITVELWKHKALVARCWLKFKEIFKKGKKI